MSSTARPRAPALRTQARPVALLSRFQLLVRPNSSGNKKGLLVDELLRLTKDCDAGFKTRQAERETISSLVEELSAFCPKNPLSRPELIGRWEVRYASKPKTAGGPFKTLPGRVVFPGQVAIQEIREPDIIINEINFKTLGFVPGSVTQVGTITPVSGSAFEIEFSNSTKRVGGPQKRTIELLYLDEDIRIARAVPREEGQEGSFYVFQREGMEFELDGEEDGEEDGEDEDAGGEGRQRVQAARTRPAPQSKRSAEDVREERAAAAERARLERASAAEEARAQREALASRKAVAKEIYADLSTAAREGAVLAQSSAKELAELEREGAKIIRDASTARRLIEKSEEVVGSLLDKLEETQADGAALEKELLASQRQLSQVRAELAKTKKALSVN